MSVKERIHQLVETWTEEEAERFLLQFEQETQENESPKTGLLALDALLKETADLAPRDEVDRIPTDFSEQHDHYIYGTPKR
jgi:hypothetical protein